MKDKKGQNKQCRAEFVRSAFSSPHFRRIGGNTRSIAEEEALVYDVSSAYKPASKGGWAARRQKEVAASEE